VAADAVVEEWKMEWRNSDGSGEMPSELRGETEKRRVV
jgi:hypothetical protein